MSTTTSDLIDWFLNRTKSGPLSSVAPAQDQRDFRGLCTTSDLHEILTKYSNSKLMPSADDIKSPNDYWTFLEPLFSIALSSNMIPATFPLPDYVGETKTVLSSRQTYPAYQWQWAVEDCLDLSHFSPEDAQRIKDEVMRKLPRDNAPVGSPFPLISDELKKSVSSLDEINRSISSDFLLKLRKWVSATESSEPLIRKKNSEILFLANFCESLLLQQIEREQFLDSIEEVHSYGDQYAVIVDDAERVKLYYMSESDLTSVLVERDSTIGGPQIESAQFSYPFDASTVLQSVPQIGAFCHVCRRRKSEEEMPKCTNKISPMDFAKTNCHRRFCNDCLTAYNWPKPLVNTQWKCPICSKLCTCDRCVRNVFIRSLKNFVTATRGVTDAIQQQSITFPFTSNAYEIWEIVTPESQYASHLAQSAPESPPIIPTSDVVGTSATQRNTVRRQTTAPPTPPEESGGTKRRRSIVDDARRPK
jgi:hypothetical protein